MWLHSCNLDGFDGKRFPEYRTPKYFFKHKSDENAEFWYPIDIQEEATVLESWCQPPFISYRTSLCWLDATTDNRGELRSSSWVLLWNDAGTWAGALNIHNYHIIPILEFVPLPLLRLAHCELIAISMGIAQKNLDEGTPLTIPEYNCEERPKTYSYLFYNVLWIEWEGGIAYRKGLGRVEDNMREAQPLEWIDVILGWASSMLNWWDCLHFIVLP